MSSFGCIQVTFSVCDHWSMGRSTTKVAGETLHGLSRPTPRSNSNPRLPLVRKLPLIVNPQKLRTVFVDQGYRFIDPEGCGQPPLLPTSAKGLTVGSGRTFHLPTHSSTSEKKENLPIFSLPHEAPSSVLFHAAPRVK